MSDQNRDPKRITREFMQALTIHPETAKTSSLADRLIIPILLGFGIAAAAVQVLWQDWLEFALIAASIVYLLVLATSPRWQQRILGQAFNRRHALYFGLFWIYSISWLSLLRFMLTLETAGKNSIAFWILLVGMVCLTVMLVRVILMLTKRFYPVFSTAIPIWEQLLLTANEIIAALVMALFWGNLLAHWLQPRVFTVWHDPLYTAAIGASVLIYYFGMQLMWLQRWNNWLSQTRVWVRLARLLSPLALLVIILLIARRIIERSDLRSATLISGAGTNLAILAIAPVILLLIVVIMVLVYTSDEGIRRRFLPDLLLERLPPRSARVLRSISDMDLTLIVILLALLMPLIVLTNGSGVLASVRNQISQTGGALIETPEQTLALLAAFPFYLIILGLLILYAFVIARSSLSAHQRDELVSKLPLGFLIIMIMTLYLFALPFSQALIEGRLPRLPQDLGRILLFTILIPLVLLYAHYFFFVRLPYARGQRSWRSNQTTYLSRQLDTVDRRITTLNSEIERLDTTWRGGRNDGDPALRLETLYRYVQLNGMRDDMNMQRLQVVSERQQLAELSDAPVSVAVARLPLRIVSIGIPLLLMIQLYQWAVLNNGVREIVNNPNLTVVDFFREILGQLNF